MKFSFIFVVLLCGLILGNVYQQVQAVDTDLSEEALNQNSNNVRRRLPASQHDGNGNGGNGEGNGTGQNPNPDEENGGGNGHNGSSRDDRPDRRGADTGRSNKRGGRTGGFPGYGFGAFPAYYGHGFGAFPGYGYGAFPGYGHGAFPGYGYGVGAFPGYGAAGYPFPGPFFEQGYFPGAYLPYNTPSVGPAPLFQNLAFGQTPYLNAAFGGAPSAFAQDFWTGGLINGGNPNIELNLELGSFGGGYSSLPAFDIGALQSLAFLKQNPLLTTSTGFGAFPTTTPNLFPTATTVGYNTGLNSLLLANAAADTTVYDDAYDFFFNSGT
eukprot:CAMPEP_0206402528 /NCGR_PEP_ID=MMETSP0294-20121207/27043_1 /ASSEMBLY_ACC=CAM_ASM_000327 /TAXON_ID=39354 /ORGANISM="Heterosigma akashiwo, Strain CCMP2393" /LENGTH=324 /DNA_ID=CAMNT_0053859685 /DNA_START=370 /DNA_END=1344 /DNA_ORIENTATION=+